MLFYSYFFLVKTAQFLLIDVPSVESEAYKFCQVILNCCLVANIV